MKKEETATVNKFIKEINKGVGVWDQVDGLSALVASYEKYLDCISKREEIEELEGYREAEWW